MCGIAGFIEFGEVLNKQLPETTLQNMLNSMINRGPDDYGMCFWKENNLNKDNIRELKFPEINPNTTVAFGHRRLSIIDLSEHGLQPMFSSDKNLAIIFNGEIYNYLELKKAIGDDYSWQSNSDTEVILAAYQKWGVDMLSKFDGMFAFVLLDIKKKKIIGARDVAGIKPLYYKQIKNRFVFASEPKVIKKYDNSELSFDSKYLSEFLVLGVSDHDEGTMIEGVNQLKGGNLFELDLESQNFRISKYHKLNNEPITSDLKTFREDLLVAVSRQLRSDVPIGTSLSGGIDSSVIATMIGDLLGDKKNIYKSLTFTSPDFQDDESELAKIVAKNSQLEWVPVSPGVDNLKEDLKNMIVNMGEPFSSLSMFAQYSVMQKAQKLGIKVMLDGQGGDELYLGYPRMAQRVMISQLKSFNFSGFVNELVGLKKNLSISYTNALAGNIYFNSRLIAFGRKLNILTKYINKDYLSNLRQELVDDFFAPKDVTSKQKDEFYKYCLPRLLRYADRNSMASSIESRVPHLSNIMIDKALNLPIDMKVKGGWTKYILRKSMDGKVPEEILWCTVKKGFGVPQDYWVSNIKEELTSWVHGLDNSSPINKDQVLKDIELKPGSTFLWPVLSAIALNQLSNIKF